MRYSITKLLLPVLLGIVFSGCAHADSLVGVWQSDPALWGNPTGRTNKLEGFFRIEFLNDGKFKIGPFMKDVSGQEIPMPLVFEGKYQVVDSGHIKLEWSKTPQTPSGGRPMILTYSISCGTLDLQGLSHISQTTKYRGVTQVEHFANLGRPISEIIHRFGQPTRTEKKGDFLVYYWPSPCDKSGFFVYSKDGKVVNLPHDEE